MTPTQEQSSAVDMVIKYRVSILTGGPGTGKTFTTKIIIEWAKSRELVIVQAAPTGKAAKRMMEATQMVASTIHVMLGCMVDPSGQFVFGYNKDNPIPADLVILDEISMLTNNLMARVMEAIDIKRTRLLLIGDENQLPSVGAGAVLRDILASKIIPHTQLTQIHRNTGAIVRVCRDVKEGVAFSPAKRLDLDHPDGPVNLIHIECNTPDRTLAGVKAIVRDRMPVRGYDPVDDVQVISPVNTKGPLSCENINQILRKELNPFEQLNPEDRTDVKDFDSRFWPGDKVINTKNSRATETNGRDTYIVNGDIGRVVSVSGKRMRVRFADPDREVFLTRNDKHLLHAYCITCHRFQGSEAPVIVIPVHKQFNHFLSNSWIYTALSRGKEIVITIGAFSTIERAIRNRTPNNRNTGLKRQLLEERQNYIEKEFADI